MTGALVGLISGLMGAIIGFLGALYLERRREALQKTAEIKNILLEMGTLEGTLKQALEDGIRLRETLQRNVWDRFHPDLVNWLPWHLVKLLHTHHNLFDTIRVHYDLLATKKITGTDLEDLSTFIWTFVYWSQSLRLLVMEALEKMERSLLFRVLGIREASKQNEQAFEKLLVHIQDGARDFVHSKGLPTRPLRPIPDYSEGKSS
jgi:hypothetical protein